MTTENAKGKPAGKVFVSINLINWLCFIVCNASKRTKHEKIENLTVYFGPFVTYFGANGAMQV